MIMDKALKDMKIDRTFFSVDTDHEKSITYWITKTPEERWQGIEALRQIFYNYDPITDRVQRVLEVRLQAVDSSKQPGPSKHGITTEISKS